MALSALEAFKALQARNQIYYQAFDAWYSGDEQKLMATSKPGRFWQTTKYCTRKVHVPIAAEIASMSADLLFAEPISVYADDVGQQTRLDEILQRNDFNSKVYAAAETCAAFGDTYLKINWNKEIAEMPLLNVVNPQNAFAEYENDILQTLHFITMNETQNNVVWIYERYERNSIIKEVYSGTKSQPNKLISSETVETGIDELLAVHIPNLTPNRHVSEQWRGRSDLDGLIGLMDALDEAYSSWVRDLNLGKARLIVPRDYFRADKNPFTGEHIHEYTARFDKDDEVFVAMDVDPDRSNNGGFVEAQFEIRSQQHKQTCEALKEQIITAAGYSPQTFGFQIQGNAQSGTALNIRERKTYTTKARKEIFWNAALHNFLTMVLEVDKNVFSQPYTSTVVSVEFKEAAQDIGNIAQAIEMLSRAGAISTYEKVKRVNPDWTDEQILEEVRKILEETGIALFEDQNSLSTDLDEDIDAADKDVGGNDMAAL